jgi:methionyl-tRNA formyltransferase
MKIIFMGTPDFAVPSLEILVNNKYHIAAVVTAPDKPRGRGQQVSFTPVKEAALKYSLPVLQPDSLHDPSFISSVHSYLPDLIVVVAFRILPAAVFTIPPGGTFNLHASLLPRYRGAAPINWAIMNGEKESGVTTFFLKEKVDTGDIILQARVAISDTMTAGELHDTLAEVGAEIVLQTVRLIELGKAQPRRQENDLSSPAPKIFRDDCKIGWNSPSSHLHNFIRGLSPAPTAWTTHNGTILKVYRSEMGETADEKKKPGIVSLLGSTLSVATQDGAISILEIQQEGKKRMSAGEFLRGYKLTDGELLG